MKNTVRPSVVLFIFSALLAIPHTLSAQAGDRVWNFDHDTEGKPPEGFLTALTGQGRTGQWVVMKDATAPSQPHVLAQTSQDKTDYRFPIAIAEGTSYRDLALSVRFKAISGRVDQGVGLVFRLKDKDNYYVARANALEDNRRLYHVVNGKRIQFAGANFKLSLQEWHEIKIEVRGDEFRCYYDGQLKSARRTALSRMRVTSRSGRKPIRSSTSMT